jgi:hypothetical protein
VLFLLGSPPHVVPVGKSPSDRLHHFPEEFLVVIFISLACVSADLLPYLHFYPEDGGDTFLSDLTLFANYTELQPIRICSSAPYLGGAVLEFRLPYCSPRNIPGTPHIFISAVTKFGVIGSKPLCISHQ